MRRISARTRWLTASPASTARTEAPKVTFTVTLRSAGTSI